MSVKKVAFVGLGLLGGSLAKRIRQCHPGVHIAATTHSPQTMALALSEGVIDTAGTLSEVVAAADIVFIATPIELITKHSVQTYKHSKSDAVIVDIGSTKTAICKALQRYADKFIGGHPMAGTEKSGYSNSFADMLDKARFVLTPYKNTPKKKLTLLQDFIKELGMQTAVMTPEVHDQAVAAVSHVPYFAAIALVGLVDSLEKKHLAATGFQSSTRVAGSDAAWGVDVARTNKKAVLKELKRLQKELSAVVKLIEAGQLKKLHTLLQQRRKQRTEMYPQ